MRTKTAGKSHLFFIEFLIVLFFFLIISTICLRTFSRAHQITAHADALSHAQAAAASVAEVLISGEELTDYFPGYTIYYDSSFELCEASDESCAYILTVFLQTEDQEQTAEISVTDQNTTLLYELSVHIHQPLTREEVLS